MRTKLISLVLAVIMIASALALCVSAEGVCLHDTQKGLVKTDTGYTIANVCRLCGEAVVEIGYVDSGTAITLYKESAKTVAYTSAELATGISSANGNGLYVNNGILSTSGKPYWFTFDLVVNGLPVINEGDGQADLSNPESRAYKGWSVICVCNNSFDANLRLIADGWEEDSGADGTAKGKSDGYAPIKFANGSSAYRFNDTVVNIKAGDKISFALRVDPATGNYDAYVNNLFAGSGEMGTKSTDSSPFIRLWEGDGKSRGGNLDFSNIECFLEDYTKVEHYHNYTEYTEFYDKGLYRYERCECGERNELECEQITSVVSDGLAHIYDGLGNFTVNADSYWFVTDMVIKGEIKNGSLLKFGDDVILESKDGKMLSGSAALGAVSYPQTYQVAVKLENGEYDLYVNGRYAVSGDVANTAEITCGDIGFYNHVGFMYNKAVTLGKTDSPVIPTYTADTSAKICYHSDGGTTAKNKILAHTKEGVEYIYNCTLCGERVYSMLKKDLTNPANDVAYKNRPYALTLAELGEFSVDKPRYLYLENNVISNTAEPYWLTFDVTPKSLPSNETGDLNDPNSRVYKGYALISTEPAFSPYAELQVIPDGWEEGNGNGTEKGITDGKCEVKVIMPSELPAYKYNTQGYRFAETVAYLEVGVTTSFALRIDPATGIYDVYVNGSYKASAQKMTSADMNPRITFHDNGMGDFVYSNVSVCEEAQNFNDKVTAFEFTAKFEADETASENAYTALFAISRNGKKYNFLYANNKTGELAFKDEDGKLNTLYDTNSDVIYLTDSKQLAVIYDDINGDVRYFAGEKLARYKKDGKLVMAYDVDAYDKEFVNSDGIYDSLHFDPRKITGLNVIGLGKTDTAEVVGFQAHELENSIRILSGLDSLYYGATGFEVQAYMTDGTPYRSAPISKTANTLYSGIKAGKETIPATKFGYNYFSALSIDGDLLKHEGSYIIVKPFTVVGDDKYYGEAVRINIIANGKYEFAENN